MRRWLPRSFAAIVAAAALHAWGLAAPAAAEPLAAPVDWSKYADVETVIAVTADEDGAPRETTIWLVVVDGAAFIRTGNTNWGDNVVREPLIALRIDATEIPVRVSFIEDDALRDRVIDAFRAKYGFMDGALDIFRGDRPKIMQLEVRS